jgi:uncharacterized protein YyaL (SSP411 family)
MISAMAQAGSVLAEPRFTTAAAGAADFILEKMRDPGGHLLHTYKDGTARLNAYLDDYACLIEALVEVYQATFDAKYLDAAVELAKDILERYGDNSGGGFFFTPHDHEPLIARNKDVHDNATPSGNATAACALLKLSQLSGRTDLEEAARQTLEMLSGEMTRVSMAMGQALLAVDDLLGPAYEIVIVDGTDVGESDRMLRMMAEHFVPTKVVARRPRDVDDSVLPAVLRPLLEGKREVDGQATLYLCQRGTCQAPVKGLSAIEALLQNI